MTDRELLELAAKAAGIEHVTPMLIKRVQWNPLTDDGDALRLAVKLRLSINLTYGDVAIVGQEHTQAQFCLERNADNSDPYAATCRAIVRAAAEIGKAME